MKRIRIYVGLIDKDGRVSNSNLAEYQYLFNSFIHHDLSAYFDGASIFDAVGFWKGTQEPSKVIEILMDDDSGSAVRLQLLVKRLKSLLNQEAVMVTSEELHVSFV